MAGALVEGTRLSIDQWQSSPFRFSCDLRVGFSDTYDPGFAIFVDEAGDPGIRKVRTDTEPGSSEWFTMAAMVIDQTRDAQTIEWARSIRTACNQTQGPAFHYADLPQGRRRTLAASMLAELPCRLFVVCSHKPNMSGHANARAERMGAQNYFYNWVLRVLLERATGWIKGHSLKTHGEVRKARLVLSAAGGLDYSQLTAYHEWLRFQSQGKGPYLNARNIEWDVLAPSLYEPVPHRKNAGVQLADIAASAFYQAAHTRARHHTLEPALALRPRIATARGRAATCGVTLMPLKPKQQKQLSPEQRAIFEAYGYAFN